MHITYAYSSHQEIWDEDFGISSIHMVWYIVCSGWKTWLIKMFEMRLRVKGDLVLMSSKSTSSYKPTQKLIKYWKSGNLILTWAWWAQLYFSRWFCSSSKIITKCMGLVHVNQKYVMTVMRKDWMMGRHLKSIWYPDNCGFVSDVATVFLIISSILILHHQPGRRVVAGRKVFVPHIMITMIVSIPYQRDGGGWLTHISLRATAENWVSSFLSFYCRR